MGQRLKKGDLVHVIAGKDKGVQGRVLKILKTGRVLVEGINKVKRHQSPQRFKEAGIIEKEAPIDASNIMLVDPTTEKPTRVRFAADKKDPNKKVRIAVKSGESIN